MKFLDVWGKTDFVFVHVIPLVLPNLVACGLKIIAVMFHEIIFRDYHARIVFTCHCHVHGGNFEITNKH